MSFTSLWYWLFFVVVTVFYFGLPRRAAVAVLAAAGFVFYAFWDVRFVALLAGSTVFNFLTGLAIDRAADQRFRRVWLVVALVGNLLILGFFKYAGFAAGTIGGLFGFNPAAFAAIILPVGISFYTFEGIAYNMDIYRGELRASRNIVDFSLFMSFFPHLISGPIIRPMHFFPQIAFRRIPDAEETRWGLIQILKGLIKKTVFADHFASFSDGYFNGVLGHGGTGPALIGIVAFSMQIYFDFAGYTDIARGCAKLLGITFPPNFERPYLSSNIAEFWRRWHISLSTWLRDYLYVPLGGNRKSSGRTYVNLMLVMTLGGLWHGASWNFVVWGAYHGILLMVHRAYAGLVKGTRFEAIRASFLWRALSVALTFTIVTLGWIPFRTRSFAQTGAVVSDIFSFSSGGQYPTLQDLKGFAALLVATCLWVLIDRHRRIQDWLVAGGVFREALAVAASLLVLALLSRADVTIPFIYFQF